MTNYLLHLRNSYKSKTFKRKIDYIKYNFGKIISKVIISNGKVLEIGPGKGEFVKYLNSLSISDVDIVDNDSGVINSVKRAFKVGNSFLCDDVSHISKKLKKYDLIMMIQVFEHIPIEKYISTLRVLYRHLRNQGYLVIVVPNASNPLGLVERYGDLQHTNSFTEMSLRDLIRISGIKNYDFKISGFSIPPYSLVNIIRIVLQKAIHLFLTFLLILNGGVFCKTMTPNITLIIKKLS